MEVGHVVSDPVNTWTDSCDGDLQSFWLSVQRGKKNMKFSESAIRIRIQQEHNCLQQQMQTHMHCLQGTMRPCVSGCPNVGCLMVFSAPWKWSWFEACLVEIQKMKPMPLVLFHIPRLGRTFYKDVRWFRDMISNFIYSISLQSLKAPLFLYIRAIVRICELGNILWFYVLIFWKQTGDSLIHLRSAPFQELDSYSCTSWS